MSDEKTRDKSSEILFELYRLSSELDGLSELFLNSNGVGPIEDPDSAHGIGYILAGMAQRLKDLYVSADRQSILRAAQRDHAT